MDKSLPELPPTISASITAPEPGTLSVDARKHFKEFLRHALKEEGVVPEDESNEDVEIEDEESKSWANEMEKVLDELARCVEAGGWLKGFRRAKVLVKERTKVEKATDAQSAHKVAEGADRQSTEDSNTEADNGSDSGSQGHSSRSLHKLGDGDSTLQTSNGTSDGAVSAGTSTPRHNLVLQQLGSLSSKPRPRDLEQHALHLLLIVDPAESSLADPVIHDGQDNMPTPLDCSFVLDEYNCNAEGLLKGTVLFGADEWNGSLFSFMCLLITC